MVKVVLSIFFVSFLNLSTSTLAGNKEAGEARYYKSCNACHGPAGKGAASYPKISGREEGYVVSRLETYRAGKEFSANDYDGKILD